MEIKCSFCDKLKHFFDFDDLQEPLEHVSCNLCGGSKYKVITQEDRFDVRQCLECKLVYVSPQLSNADLPKFYEAMYTEETDEAAHARSLGYAEKNCSKVVNLHCTTGKRLLDIGCGYGLFLKEMSGTGWELNATEVSEAAIRYTEANVPDVKIKKGLAELMELPEESLDCIVGYAVLEHVKDPRSFITHISKWLVPGGLIVLAFPYIVPFLKIQKFVPGLSLSFEAPRHLYDFSPKTIKRYLKELGYEDVRVEIAPPFAANSKMQEAQIWCVKLLGLALYKLSGNRYVYPFSSSLLVHAIKR